MHNNAFDHLRLIAAFMVLVSHQFGITQTPAAWPFDVCGQWGVDIFFAISGYLNTRSLLASKSWWVFLASRALRIYPALIFCVVTMILIGAAVTTWSLSDYFGRITFDFFWRNSGLFFGQRSLLPGVFETQHSPGTNASLWTLPIEGRFYLYLAAALFALRYRPPLAIAVGLAGLVAALWIGTDASLEHPAGRLGTLFASGIFIAVLEKRFGLPSAIIALGTVAALLAIRGQTFAATKVVFALGAVFAGFIAIPQRMQPPLDLSYGVYLFAFPIQQLTGVWMLGFWDGFAVTVVTTFAIALVSAIVVERPALRLASKIKASVGKKHAGQAADNPLLEREIAR